MTVARSFLVLAVMATALSACGNRRALKPVAGQALPPAPYGREVKPDADDLLQVPVQAKPERSVELRSRSQDRDDDPFNLPPQD
ncbi:MULTISPECIES: hypothetical protein [Novosphingobium]|uniref:hypothetical protein n=1 Tax=Novosphingobium TaxID=165696 RepID=UPI001CD80655|nr:hypothetical protein [Novosphingobium percolationis]